MENEKIPVIELMTISNGRIVTSMFISMEMSENIQIQPFPDVLPIFRKSFFTFARRTVSPVQYRDEQKFQSIEMFINFFRFGNASTGVDMEPMFEAAKECLENRGILWCLHDNDTDIPAQLTVSKRYIRGLRPPTSQLR